MAHRAKVLRSQTAPASQQQREGAAASDGGILVIGSCFLDYIGYLDRLPKAGETLTSSDFAKGFGGKGANQAVMAAKLGAKVAMMSAVGDDGDGADYIKNFKSVGVDTRLMTRVPKTATGLAMIAVSTQTAQNLIVICPNAAAKQSFELLFGPDGGQQAARIDATLKPFKILITQNEIPLATTLRAMREAKQRGLYTIFNTAPAPSPADVEAMKPALQFVSCICPNEHEAALITGVTISNEATAREAVERFRSALGYTGDIVITLGSLGVLVSPSSRPAAADAIFIVATKVKAVDTTGAGDSFVGSMAYFLAAGASLEESCRRANVVAGDSVTKRGTQSSYATRAQLPASLFTP